VNCRHATARAVKHLGVAQSGRALGLGPRDARSNRATQTARGKRSGDRVCATSRSRRVRSPRPAPCRRSPTGRGSTLRTCAVSVRIGPSVRHARICKWQSTPAQFRWSKDIAGSTPAASTAGSIPAKHRAHCGGAPFGGREVSPGRVRSPFQGSAACWKPVARPSRALITGSNPVSRLRL
jgi:hypothetical protein